VGYILSTLASRSPLQVAVWRAEHDVARDADVEKA
jgi:hypothetical protein